MRKIQFVFSVLFALVTVGCYNPVNNIVEVPAEDKSPFEYVMPENVDLNDYTYVGDVIFGDLLDFSKWAYTNRSIAESADIYNGISQNIIVLEKIARVNAKYPEDSSKLIKEFDGTEDVECLKATTYKCYVLNDVISNADPNNANTFINNSLYGVSGMYRVEGNIISMRIKLNGGYRVTQYDSTSTKIDLEWYE